MEKIKKLLHGKNSVKGATGILVVTLLISNIMGLLRDHFLAQKISVNNLDTYYAAFRIPDLIFNLLILGAISAAFIPVFTSYISKREEEEAWHVANSFLNIAIIALILFAVILAIFMPNFISMLVPEFTSDKKELTIKLARVMLFSPVFFGISYIFGGILNSYKRFLVYSIAPLVYNLSIIISTLLLADKMGVWGVVYGVIIGAFLHMVVQIPAAIKMGYRYSFVFDWYHKGVRKIFSLMIPRAIGLGAMQGMLLVYTFIASSLGAGAVAIYNLADNIQTMPVVVFGTSFATAIFPTLSESVSLGKMDEFTKYFWRTTRSILFLLIPAGLGIILLRTQIVRLILGSGPHFGWEQTINTSYTLGFLAISLFAQGLSALFARSFYANHDTKTPMYITIVSFIVSIIFGLVLPSRIGGVLDFILSVPILNLLFSDQFVSNIRNVNTSVTGLGLAFSIGSIVNAKLLYLYLRKSVKEIRSKEKESIYFIIKILISSVIMAVAVQLSKYAIEPYLNMQYAWGVFAQTLLAISVGSGIYLLSAWIFKCEEISDIIDLLKKRFSVITRPNEN